MNVIEKVNGISSKVKNMNFKLDYSQVKGVLVFMEVYTNRIFVGTLVRNQGIYEFTYEKSYLKYKKAIPMGLDLPLTRSFFKSEILFASFQERIPSKGNRVLTKYCDVFGISIHEKDPLIILSTIARKGLYSCFIFSPLWKESFTVDDLRKFRKYLGLSTHDFEKAFGVAQASLVRVENGQASGSEILKKIEIFYENPEMTINYIKKYGNSLHSTKKEKLLSKLKELN